MNSRHGDIIGFKRLVDKLHNNDIGVILDWVHDISVNINMD